MNSYINLNIKLLQDKVHKFNDNNILKLNSHRELIYALKKNILYFLTL